LRFRFWYACAWRSPSTRPNRRRAIGSREFLRTTQEIDNYLEELRQEGRKEGRDEGFAQAVLAAYVVRFGAAPGALVAAIEQACDRAALQRWLEIVTTRSAEDVARAQGKPRSTSSARREIDRRHPSPRRPSAAADYWYRGGDKVKDYAAFSAPTARSADESSSPPAEDDGAPAQPPAAP